MTKPKHPSTPRTKVVKRGYVERAFWDSIKGLGGGQWEVGFRAGVAAYVRFLKNYRNITVINPFLPSPKKKTK